MTAHTGHTRYLHSRNNSELDKSTNIAPTIKVPGSAVTSGTIPKGQAVKSDMASTFAPAYHVKPTTRKTSKADPDCKEFVTRWKERQDSQATLIEGRRCCPSRTNDSKFQLNAVADETQVSEPSGWLTSPSALQMFDAGSRLSYSRDPKSSPDLESGSGAQTSRRNSRGWSEFAWRPILNPLQSLSKRPQRLDSAATLVDAESWQSRDSTENSRSQSIAKDSFRERLRSSSASVVDTSPCQSLRQPLTRPPRSRQKSFLGPGNPFLIEVPDTTSPELKMPKPVQRDITYHLNWSTNVDRFKDEDVGLLVGGIKPIEIDDEIENQTTEPELAVAEPPTVTQEPKSTHQEWTITTVQGSFVDRQYPIIADPVDPCRTLSREDLVKQRVALSASIGLVNAAMLFFALFAPKAIAGRWVFSFILFVKAKDCVSAVVGMLYVVYSSIRNRVNPPVSVKSKWILCLIPAFSEEEEMIKNCVFSLRDNGAEPHKQVMCIVLDGKPRNIKQYMRITHSFRRDYVTSRFKRNQVEITAGFMEDIPVICFEKTKNAGKKDSLILCHDLFNVMRDDAPLYTRLLRKEIEKEVLPTLVGKGFPGFDMIFCTDADSVIHKGAVAGLANAIARDPKAIAACGLVLVDLEPGAEWSFWNLYQQFQYNFGQFVRRQAEGAWRKVTCLPGCITMIAVRPEMAGAIRKYAAPVTIYPVLLHQVQYLGTDRRLTYSMLSQSKDLHTLFVPTAVSETVAPQSLKHYLSQRRRWGSNAYFNNYFYFAGENMILVTRLWALIEVLRLSLVYYRIANTIMFVYGLIGSFSVMSLIPLLVVSQIPNLWFLANLIFVPQLRVRSHKIILGLLINKFVSPITSILVFTSVVKNLGSQAWGLTHPVTAVPTANPTIEKGHMSQDLFPVRKRSLESIVTEEETFEIGSWRSKIS